jgi:hypothetical protein
MANYNLPNEVWCKIFSYLPLAPKKNATATCKLWFRLIREDLKISGYIVISWLNMEEAIETLQWNWSNWPALKTLELNKLELVTDSRDSIQNVIEKLSLNNYYPPRLEEVLFDVNLIPELQTDGHSLLKYQPKTNQIYALGQKLDSIQKWNEYESIMKALKRLKSMRYRTGGTRGAVGQLPPYMRSRGAGILAELEATICESNDLLLLIATPWFQCFHRITDGIPYMEYAELVKSYDFAISHSELKFHSIQ